MKTKVIYRDGKTVAKLADEIRKIVSEGVVYKNHTVTEIQKEDGYKSYQAIIIVEEPELKPKDI